MAKKTSTTRKSTTPREPAVEKSAAPTRAPRRPAVATTRKKRTSPGSPHAGSGVTEEQIRERAYFISLERNGHPSDPLADWLRAERELTGGMRKA
jgi:hypothetical protein